MATGVAGLLADLDAYGLKIREKVLFSGVAAMANLIYTEVKINASRHRKTGLLESAVYRAFSPERSTDDIKTYRVSINKTKAPHWHFAEYGTSRQPAYPIIRAANDHMLRAIKAGQERMGQRLAEIGGKA